MTAVTDTAVLNPLGLTFTNRYTRDLPADPQPENMPRQVLGACFSRVQPLATSSPTLVAYSREVAELLGITDEQAESDEFVQVFNGNLVTADMDPFVEEIADWLRAWADRCQIDNRSAEERKLAMDAVNPKYVLRNWMAQLAIDKLDQGDDSGVQQLLDLLRYPYDEQPEHEVEFFAKRPEWARERAGCSMLSCSS